MGGTGCDCSWHRVATEARSCNQCDVMAVEKYSHQRTTSSRRKSVWSSCTPLEAVSTRRKAHAASQRARRGQGLRRAPDSRRSAAAGRAC